MSYMAVDGGQLVTARGFPRFTTWKPEAWIDLPRLGSIRAWVPNLDEHAPNVTGTCLMVAFGAARRPYRGRILFTGHGHGLAPRDVAVLADMHTAISSALCGLASGYGPEFDEQTISTAQMAETGEEPTWPSL